jgi:hypothetical protein
MIPQLLARAFAAAGKTVVAAAVNAVVVELRKPETQAKLQASAQQVASTLRNPETTAKIEGAAARVRDHGARALGRAVGTLRNAASPGGPPDRTPPA